MRLCREALMHIETIPIGDVVVVVLQGDVDTTTTPDLHAAFDDLVARGERN